MGGRLNFDPHPQEYSIIAVGGWECGEV